MSLSGVLSAATSGLLVSQTALKTTSQNIANVNTEGYHRRTVEFGPRLTGSELSGVTLEEIRRVADQYLSQEAISSTAQAARADVLTNYFSRVQDLVASLDGEASLQSRVQSAMSALSRLSTDAASPAARGTALSAVTSALSAISAMASNVQSLRQDANAQLTQNIGSINDYLSRIFDLNSEIKRAFMAGDTSTGLLDQRDIAIAELSKLIDIRTVEQPDGRVFVSLDEGTTLISDVRTELRYPSPGTVTAETSFASLTLQQVNQSGADVGPAIALEGRIRGGELRALLDLRDKALPDLAEQLGALAGGLADQLNAIHNDSAAVPPPASLIGRNTGLFASDALNMTGRATIAVVDQQGVLVQSLDLDFSTIATVGDLVAAINGGLGGTASATFTDGVLRINATGAGNGIAIKQDEAAPSARGGHGFSQFFGLNDLITAGSPSNFATGMAAGNAHGFTAGGTTSFVLRGPQGQILREFSVTVAGGGTVGNLVTSLNAAAGGLATFSLAADGTLTMTPATPGARLEVTNDTTTRGATGVSLSEFFGLGHTMRANQAASLAVRSDIAANVNKLALAQLDISSTTAPGDVVLGVSDNRGALGLAAVANASYTWPAAGGFGSSAMTLSDFTARVLAGQADLASSAEADRVYREDIKAEVLARKGSLENVNLDEELAAMMSYQQAYNASARMITAVQQMFDTLMNAV